MKPLSSLFRPLFTVIGVMISTLSLNILGVLLWLFVRIWNRPLYRSLLSRFGFTRWIETTALLLPDTRYIVHGDPVNLHMAHQASLVALAAGEKQPEEAAEDVIARRGMAGSAHVDKVEEKSSVTSPLSIMICNHQVDLDWLYLWDLCRLSNSHSSIKVILKDTLKYVPLIGMAMSLLEFLFLKRDWESDRANLQTRLASFRKDHVPLLLIIFPEGTTVNTRARDKSQAFSREKQRPHLDLLLLPRVTGFQACVQSLGAGSHTIYDVTMAFSGYSGEVPTYEMGYERARDKEIPNAGKVLMGHRTEVHVDVRAIQSTEILKHHDSIEKWLDERWVRKERLMKYFAEHQRFPEEEVGPGRTAVASGKLSSMLELWSVVAFSVILLPFALMMFIPYALIVALSYSYIKWHEYTSIMLSREEQQDYRQNVKTTVLKSVAFVFLFCTILAWSYSFYSVLVNILLPAVTGLWA